MLHVLPKNVTQTENFDKANKDIKSKKKTPFDPSFIKYVYKRNIYVKDSGEKLDNILRIFPLQPLPVITFLFI